ncbi:hypothetical protein [Microbacterium deminutum]|uniref:VWFA domain-containing protein n=1 Tax=Microbacterium deminutum TaxID=344164 RepID=A0ABN2Q6F6_9MICO
MRRRWATLAAAVLVIALPLLATPAADAAPAPAVHAALTPTGHDAVADLRTCVASRGALNAYYIIDNSQSLRVEDDGRTPGSDPDYTRADILGNSLAQLGLLGAGTKVNWAAGFFSTGFEPAISWTPWTNGSAAKLESTIRAKQPNGYTNWLAAMEGTQRQLAIQPDAGHACQLVVWFTDGAIDLEGGDQATADALNDLCGQPIDPAGHAPAQGYGLFSAFRQSGVVVMGTLLAHGSTRDAAGVMWPLVEGSGDVGGTPEQCGQPDPPSTAVHGAVVDASDPGALARVFLELASQIAGGYPEPLDAQGRFWIDPGVSRFQIALGAGDWSLVPPSGSGLATLTAANPGPAAVTSSAGATLIEVPTADSALQGQWQLKAADVDNVYLFSDLGIVFGQQNTIELGADGATSATLTAQVQNAHGEPAPLDLYGAATFTASILGPDGNLKQLADAHVDRQTGAITIPMPTDVAAAEIVVTASLGLKTTPHGLALAPVTTQQAVKTVLPANFPRMHTTPVQLSTLEGADGAARGGITVDGPQSGGDGKVCIAQTPEVISDSANRAAGWEWQLSADLDSDGCVVVAQGAKGQRIKLTATNHTAADSLVRASVPVVFVSSEGKQLTQDVPIEFRSTHPVNVGSVALVALGLLLLGILLPLILLWILNWWTTRLEVGNAIQRATFPVRVAPRGVEVLDVPVSDTALSERFRYRGEARNVRALADPDLGRIHARLPWFPLNAPEYEIAPPAGVSIAAARTGARTASAGVRSPDGALRFRQLPFDAFWAITVTDAELARTAKGAAVSGTAVLYHRFDAYEPSQYRERLADIARETTASDAIDRLRVARAAEASAGSSAGSPATAGAGEGAGELVPAGAATPPPRGASGRGGPAAPAPAGGPPPRPGTVPGGPPPRPSAAPGGPPPLPDSPPPRPGTPPRGR